MIGKHLMAYSVKHCPEFHVGGLNQLGHNGFRVIILPKMSFPILPKMP